MFHMSSIFVILPGKDGKNSSRRWRVFIFSLLFVGMDLAMGVSGGVSAVSWFLSLFSLP